MAIKEHKESKELLAERGCVSLDCGGRAQQRHRFSTGDGASKAAWRFASRRSPKKFSCSYVALYSLRFLVILSALVLPSVFSYAEDLTTLDGKTFTNITEVAKYPKLVVFTYNENRTSVAVSNLPVEFCTKYDVKEHAKKSVPQTISQPTNSIDLFLARNRDTDLFECDSELFSTNHVDKSWQLCLHGIEVALTSYTTDWHTTPETRTSQAMHFNLGQEVIVNEVFNKFVEWDAVALKNNAVPFEKEIGRCRDANTLSLDGWHFYSFHWNSGLNGSSSSLWDSGVLGGIFYRDDVVQFREMLKRLPAFKEKLAEKIRNQEAQQSLFK